MMISRQQVGVFEIPVCVSRVVRMLIGVNAGASAKCACAYDCALAHVYVYPII